ncbi:MAG: DUF4159 domain-containing protein [Verrucomicrobiales bacterium]|nr:DUF4159 domain-containing protein [Verrucomicrobiales bacterium]
MKPSAIPVLAVLGNLVVAVAALGQFSGFRTRGPSVGPNGNPLDRGDVPTWPLDEKFALDTFTFARLRYTSSRREQSSFAWWTDYADADLNLSFRIQQITSIKVNPEPMVVEITDPKLFNYPWVFMSGAGNIALTDYEAERLRTYLLSGGFLMVDDFWGQAEWDGVAQALKQVLPEFEPVDVPRNHPIFHGVYDLPDDLSLQTCNIRSAIANKDTGITWEDNHAGGNTREIHFRAIYDHRQRMMVFLCHNTDNGDGWEEESSDPWFFHTFSEQRDFPLAINILFYAMTH